MVDKYPLLVISGNHDSATRLNTGSEWFKATNLFLNTKISVAFEPVEIEDTQFFLLPYFEPQEVRNYFDRQNLKNVQEAMQLIVEKIKEKFKPNMKHVLIAHFFAESWFPLITNKGYLSTRFSLFNFYILQTGI